jgi:hypothetical protein
MSQQYQQPQYQHTQQHFLNQQQNNPGSSPSSPSQLLQRGSATASLYGPSLSRTRPSDSATIAAARAEYDAQLAMRQAEADVQARSQAEGEWDAAQQQKGNRTAFYNTAAGNALISQARQDLNTHTHHSPSAAPSDGSVLTGVHDNRQRVFHAECVLPQNIAIGVPDERNGAKFQQYPLFEYNRFDSKLRTFAGPGVDSRLKPAAYMPRRSLDVARRHDLVRNLKDSPKANPSISNYNHSLPFVAKHTNNLVSC